ncbi:GNAT family N-acetyltransferase [Micromonospora sp. NPDC092111]|uniref:GNAT family N-acetyltransferase n=1 Tax=Micromonospora sp. NPDC092111 TaxID=3364289 RepID=UPI00380CA941
MTVTVRALRPADTAVVAGVLAAAAPHHLITAEWLDWRAAGGPAAERFGVLLAVTGDEVVGAALTGLLHESAEPGLAFANLTVHPDRRRRGAGGALLAAAEERLVGLGARVAYAKVADEPAATGFAQRRGYRRGRRAEYLGLDLTLAELPPAGAPPAGVRLRAAAELADPRPLYEADLDASRDEPGETPMADISYPDWRAAYWDRPDLDRRLTTLAMVDGTVAAFTMVLTDGRERLRSGMTGTRRAHRGRGLARMVKTVALRRARDGGHRWAVTTNDAGNAPMRAINHALGYRQVAAEWRYRRDLDR